MNINDLKTKYCLDPEDLPSKTGNNVVTIAGLDTETYDDNSTGRTVKKSRHNLWFRELQLPLRMNNTRLDVLGTLLGPETDHWIGRKIALYNAATTSYGKTKLSIFISIQPQDAIPGGGNPHQLPQGGQVTQGQIITNPDAPIGEANAKRFSAALAEQGASYEDFLHWLKRTDRPAHDTTIGLDLPDLKRALTPLMQRFLREYQNPPAPTATPVEKPRELVEQAPAAAPAINLNTTGRPAAPRQVDEADDIPF